MPATPVYLRPCTACSAHWRLADACWAKGAQAVNTGDRSLFLPKRLGGLSPLEKLPWQETTLLSESKPSRRAWTGAPRAPPRFLEPSRSAVIPCPLGFSLSSPNPGDPVPLNTDSHARTHKSKPRSGFRPPAFQARKARGRAFPAEAPQRPSLSSAAQAQHCPMSFLSGAGYHHVFAQSGATSRDQPQRAWAHLLHGSTPHPGGG